MKYLFILLILGACTKEVQQSSQRWQVGHLTSTTPGATAIPIALLTELIISLITINKLISHGKFIRSR